MDCNDQFCICMYVSVNEVVTFFLKKSVIFFKIPKDIPANCGDAKGSPNIFFWKMLLKLLFLFEITILTVSNGK